MTNSSTLAHSITWKSSKQSYLTALMLVDRNLVDDCLRAYAYLRWADDEIDINLQTENDRTVFITKQKLLIERLYKDEQLKGLRPEEKMLADLIGHDRNPDSGLYSFIHNFMDVIEFDSKRKGHLVNRGDLASYTTSLSTAVMDGIQYFIGNGHLYPQNPERIKAVTGAHITHMLRDLLEDIPNGIINIPLEDFVEFGITTEHLDHDNFRRWVSGQIQIARQAFKEGQDYISSIDVLRCKLAGLWYLARFECILDAMEREGYELRLEYPERHCFEAWLKMMLLGIKVITEYCADRIRQALSDNHRRLVLPFKGSFPPYPSNK